MKIHPMADERYPFWSIDPATGQTDPRSGKSYVAIEMSDVDYAEYQAAMQKFQEWQDKIESIIYPTWDAVNGKK